MANERTAKDYLNAPIDIYKGFLVDSKAVLFNVAAYACYEFMTAQGCDFKDAQEYFGLSFGDLNHAENKGQQLFTALPRKTAFVGISKAVWLDYLQNDKTELQRGCLLAHVAIRSIIGSKKYCKLTNELMLSRMDGSNKTLNSFSPEIEQYNNHYQCNKIRTELELSWGLVTVSGRGVFCSYQLTLNALNLEVERNKKAYLIKQLQQDKKEAKEAAKQILWQRDKYNKNNQHQPLEVLENLPF